MEFLYQKINLAKEFVDNIEIPEYILNNLKFKPFFWQEEAIKNFLIYQRKANYPTHLMFNMATGTGKTYIMANLILYYYKQGYKKFIFFVNQNNIVDKTENNFINPYHTKYLFTEKIVIDNKLIEIKKVENFSDTDDIEIKFTTIQKLYNDIHLQKENQTTLDELYKHDIVMLADEAHHLNANTKNINQTQLVKTELTKKEEIEKFGWEHTIIELILKKNNQDSKNVLLEFSATIPDKKEVLEKYQDKIIYKFTLKEFLQAGYTKEINLITSNLSKKERILQALLFNWYRTKIAIKYSISNFKSVILFRSKTIEDSKNDYEEFLNLVENLDIDDFNFLDDIENKLFDSNNPYEQGKLRIKQVLEFITNNKIHKIEIVNWIKNNFQQRHTIITNSKDGTKTKEKTTLQQEKLLNSLEDKENHIKAIFTVARLTEGWDVLNLFDIVRLNEGQNIGGGHKGKTPQATIQEKQLIGRGVRYFPFAYKDKEKNKRKFDNDLEHELRILEELFYHTFDDPNSSAHNYIIELKKELKKDGFIKDNEIVKEFKIKESFKKSDFYKTTKIWYNTLKDNPNRRKKSLDDISKNFEYKIGNLILSETQINTNKEIKNIQNETLNPSVKLYDFEKHIFKKAINIKSKENNSLFRFENLKNELDIKSIDKLLNESFLGNIEIKIIGIDKFDDISNKEKLDILLYILTQIEKELKQTITPKIGSEFIPTSFSEIFDKPKLKKFKSDIEFNNEIPKNEWYILDKFIGSSEEESLIDFIQNSIKQLKTKCNEIYLLRNEEVYKIYDFKQGRGFQPDFILFLKSNELIYYQIFIEPKGTHLIETDKWKEEFLLEITKKYGNNQILTNENKNYKLVGLPFFNKELNRFKEEFERL